MRFALILLLLVFVGCAVLAAGEAVPLDPEQDGDDKGMSSYRGGRRYGRRGYGRRYGRWKG